MKTKEFHHPSIKIISLGCSKNLVDSEQLAAQLQANDFEVQWETAQKSDIVIVNTCGFIDSAKEESINTILQYAQAKEQGKIRQLIVTGCLSQRYANELREEIPEVDAWHGTMDMPQLLNNIGAEYKHQLLGERAYSATPKHYAYLKISEGCNRTCSFCAIPLMRGKHVSKSIEAIVAEAKNLAKNGVKEIMLIAQELTYYGLDLYKKRSLDQLLYALQNVDGIEWIRLHYAYPSKFPLEILNAMKDCDKVCHYLDLPLQHANDAVLKRMQRQITLAETGELIDKIRTAIPDIALRTTFLVGFPGETEAEFEDLVQFVQQQRFERLGVFTYSHEEDTAAYFAEDDVPEEIKEARKAYLMDIQQQISFEINTQKIGKTFKVLFDRYENNYFIGRTQYDSPEVDNEVLVPAKANTYLRIGDFAQIKITDASEFDLIGEVVS
ncbi:MAG: 30S ribosomal protein S12 methylthiotransferase RimO [Chitinophagales bacterium]|nr:30S ribosomal protein S12 methylthiotransferase RimO [Bacteroidota bacterium]